MILYFKQAWNLIKQEKLFSYIYIIGTGLSITMVMILSILLYIRTANIYPETNRNRMLVANRGEEHIGEGMSNSQLSLSVIEICFKSIENVEAVTVIYDPWIEENYVQPVGIGEQWPVTVKYPDDKFWTVFPFRFIAGRPFNEAEMQSGVKTAVIAESLAQKLFGTATEAIGKYVSLNFSEYRVCGVAKDVSFAMPNSYALLWIPYTVFPDYNSEWSGNTGSLGHMSAYILAPSVKDAKRIKSEAEENIRKYSQTLGEGIEFTTKGQPDLYWQYAFRNWQGFNKNLIRYGIIFLVLLLVPAISLSGMTESRMERRIAEMGVRRAFGAPVNKLMRQIISENFLFTISGGFIGLLFSYLIILFGKNWILQVGVDFANPPPEGTDTFLSPDMFLNFRVFFVALLVCFLLNLLSSLIPAWRASRKEIVYSLTAKG